MRSSVSLDHLARPKQSPTELADVLDLEQQARRRCTAASRKLMQAARSTSRELLQVARVNRAKAVRDEWNLATGDAAWSKCAVFARP